MTFYRSLIFVSLAAVCATSAARAVEEDAAFERVLLLSVDGLHAQDLERFVAQHPSSSLARLSRRGVRYTQAHTPTPSDSFPGLLALVTGGTPRTTGVYYDDSYDRTLYPPGSDCEGAAGTEVTYTEILDHDTSRLFSGLDERNLPRAKTAKGACVPVFPHDFVRVNTVFEVVRAHRGHTAWADKHPAYDLVNGPSGKGVEDLYTPEIDSQIANGGVVLGVDLSASKALCDGTTNSLPLKKVSTYTTCEPAVRAYDDVKVNAVLNEITGRSADGARAAPVPTVFGMNFQAVSVAQKLPVGGYVDASGTPSPLLASALAHVDASIGKLVAALANEHLLDATLVVVTAKHGQSPIDRAKLAMESGGRGTTSVQDPIDFVNAADPRVNNVFAPFVNPNDQSSPSVEGFFQTDDVGLLWLQDQSRSNLDGVVAQLTDAAHRRAIFADRLPSGTIFSDSIVHGEEVAAIYGDPTSRDPVASARAPNVVIQPNWGVIYSGSSKKIAEHGGGTNDDTNVALLVSNPRLHARTVSRWVSTTSVAPTILEALGLPAHALEAVRKEHTPLLPALDLD